MYQNPVLLLPRTNREDFIETVGIYDDDTFQPINLHGITTANGQAFSGSSWTVTDGAIVTSSLTPITFPAFPIGNQLSALALTVGLGLAIKAGDPIVIQDQPTGLNFVRGFVTSYSAANGALVVQIGWTFQLEIRKLPPHWQPGLDYSAFYDFGIAMDQPVLNASLGNGITIIDVGIIQLFFPEATFKTLFSGTYGMFLTMTDSVNTRQLFIGRLPVLWGGVTN